MFIITCITCPKVQVFLNVAGLDLEIWKKGSIYGNLLLPAYPLYLDMGKRDPDALSGSPDLLVLDLEIYYCFKTGLCAMKYITPDNSAI